ncbi:N-acetylmuramoyl-L-alanine amidase [Streptomyces sp. 5112.2]|uniref:N-acetylmuramoyl-L-alanine amidase n=1 Tax=Streptomyces sp. 5112.2 TaxID=1938848 RepID=UPI000AFAADC0
MSSEELRDHRHGEARGSGALPMLLGCLPGPPAVLAPALCTEGVERSVTVRLRNARHPAPAHGRPPRRPAPRRAPLRLAGPRHPAHPAAPALRRPGGRRLPAPHRLAQRLRLHDAPRIVRHLCAGRTGARAWDDIGYNFLVDRCGTIHEGRAGGVDRPVTGAHAQGFNHRSAGIAALGTFTAGVPVPGP